MSIPKDVPASLALLDALVAFPTISDRSNLELIAFVEAYLARLGVASRRFPNADGTKAALLITIGPADKAGIVLSGHTDVVATHGQDWTSDPFRMTVRDGKAYGRGTADMKAFSAIALAAVPRMLAQPLKRPIHLLLSYDEETTCLGSLDAIRAFGTDLPMPLAAIVGEPTLLEVADAHKGVTIFRTVVSGTAVHSSRPDSGANAVLGASMLIAELDRHFDRAIAKGDATGRFDPPHATVHVGTIQGGTGLNIVPERCEFAWEVRTLPDFPGAPVAMQLAHHARDAVLPRLRRGGAGASVDTTMVVDVPGLAPEPGSSAETLALRLAGRNRPICVSYCTEAGHFQRAGIPTVICGPGSIDQAHKADEFIALDQIEAGDRFMDRLISWCVAN